MSEERLPGKVVVSVGRLEVARLDVRDLHDVVVSALSANAQVLWIDENGKELGGVANGSESDQQYL